MVEALKLRIPPREPRDTKRISYCCSLQVGTTGRVLKGTLGNLKLAIKIVNLSSHSCILKELSAFNRLSLNPHVNVIRFYDLVYDTKYAYFMLELADCSLFTLVSELNGLTDHAARTYARMMTLAVIYIHSICVVHRDLKLENWGIDNSLQKVLLLDFGQSHSYGNDSEMASLLTEYCGTSSYCPPEIRLNIPYDGRAADMWCLGICFFAMIAAFLPFQQACDYDIRFNRFGREDVFIRRMHEACNIQCAFHTDAIDAIEALLCFEPRNRTSASSLVSFRWLSNQNPGFILTCRKSAEQSIE